MITALAYCHSEFVLFLVCVSLFERTLICSMYTQQEFEFECVIFIHCVAFRCNVLFCSVSDALKQFWTNWFGLKEGNIRGNIKQIFHFSTYPFFFVIIKYLKCMLPWNNRRLPILYWEQSGAKWKMGRINTYPNSLPKQRFVIYLLFNSNTRGKKEWNIHNLAMSRSTDKHTSADDEQQRREKKNCYLPIFTIRNCSFRNKKKAKKLVFYYDYFFFSFRIQFGFFPYICTR